LWLPHALEVTGDLFTKDRRAGKSGDVLRQGDRDNGGIKDRLSAEGFSANLPPPLSCAIAITQKIDKVDLMTTRLMTGPG
jgi:hypothetical protein